jgi:PAS domain S-box-containing protein
MSDPAGIDQSEKKWVAPAGLFAPVGSASARDSDHFRDVLEALPAAVYITDANGVITYYNDAAAKLWGWRPELGQNQWCGSWKLFWPDGRALPHDECPMAVALRERRIVRGMEAAAERPDGVRVPFIPYPTLLHDASGAVVGAVNMLVDISDRKRAEEYSQKLASIVESSDDAIVSKDLNGVITSWNKGAERLFGYRAAEAVGKPVSMLIPADRQDEEPRILARIRRGERIDHYETVRCRKDGGTVEISLTVSPVRGPDGAIIGASKIARNITERRHALEQQELLLREMNHRVKNLFSLANSLVILSARTARTPRELAASVGDRLSALARAHELTLKTPGDAPDASENVATLHTLIQAIVSPYEGGTGEHEHRVAVSGPDIALAANSVSALALLVHEFTTNATKYGALSAPDGRIEIQCFDEGEQFVLLWKEHGGPPIDGPIGEEGFGTKLTQATARGQLEGTIAREWGADGLTIRLSMARARLAPD